MNLKNQINKDMSYFKNRIFTELGAKKEDLLIDLIAFHPERGEYKVEMDCFSEDKDGNIKIPVYSIDRKLYTYDHPNATPTKQNINNARIQFLEITRFQNPKEYKDEKSGDTRVMKYQYPKGCDSKPYFPKLILEAYEKRTKVNTLVLTEGYFKSFKACLHGIYCIGLQSISTYKDKATGTMYADIIKFIETCDVKNIIMLYDGDCYNISEKALQQGKDLISRPSQFISSMESIRELFKDFGVDIYFACVNTNLIDGNPKGLDDLLCAKKGVEIEVGVELVGFSKPTSLFTRHNITRKLTKVSELFCVNNIESFYDLHQEQIGTRNFIFKGTKYKYDQEKQKVIPILDRDITSFCRIGDDYWENVLIPNQYGMVDGYLHKRLKGTITDDFGREAIPMIPKYKAFCNVPNHVSHQSIINDCYNLYNKFSHSFIEGDCENSLTLVKHIFGEKYFEMGLDYIQLLLQKPTEMLPVLCLVSKENKTGKSTFVKWLREIFGLNGIFVSSADFAESFNFHWAGKLLIMCEETELDKSSVMDRVKQLSTSDKITMNRKGKDHEQVAFFAKFILCSNNEDKFIKAGNDDQRYWVLKVPTIEKLDPFFEQKLKDEIPHFLYYLTNRSMANPIRVDRMWFHYKSYRTEAFEKVIAANRNKAEREIRFFLNAIFIELEYYDVYEEKPCYYIGLEWLFEKFFNRKYEREYIKYVIENMPHDIKYSSPGERKTVRCKVPRFAQNELDESDETPTIKYETYLCKPYVFYAKDYINIEYLKKIQTKMMYKQEFELEDKPF